MAEYSTVNEIQQMISSDTNLVAECMCKTNNLHPFGSRCKHCNEYAFDNSKRLNEKEYSKMMMNRLKIDHPR